MVDAFPSMSSNRELNRQVRDFNQERQEWLGVGGSQPSWRTPAARARRGTEVSRTPSRGSVRPETGDSRGSMRRSYRPRRDEDRDRRRDDRRDRCVRDDRRRCERDRDRDRARSGRDDSR